ncbi:CT620/CT621 family type III secretion system effector [Chlamydia sp. 17-3921]|uniref:CT620/CT621 family type III secretion system effector n=1 Tax=Chlamydia sp. 17-3921 TaxID=2675798 RepID=UPI001918E291|nr:CT620/CT621 family type III secretion system effector [Chlamydia sp. 17-3921]
MMNSKVQRSKFCCHAVVEQSSSKVFQEPSKQLVMDYIDASQLTHYLQVFKEILQEARNLGLDHDFMSSMNRNFLDSGVELAIVQTLINEQSSKEIRKQNDKVFHKNLQKHALQALTTASELSPQADSIVNKMPFQSAFAYILLDKYIPSQESALYALGRELNLAGYAQNTFSPLLEVIKNFNSAPINYNLGSYISQTDGTSNFKYGYELVMSRYEEERAQLRNDIKSVESAKDLLTKIIKGVKTNSSLTDAQQTQLVNITNSYVTSLNTIENQLKSLMSNLNSLIFSRGADEYSPSFRVMGADFSISDLQETERIVVDGVINISTAETSGGLLNFFNTVLADVQNYGDLAQTQQLMLDLQMKAMQQQWSLISSSLRLMDGIYRTLISGFKA